MKVAPVSGDFLVELALLAGACVAGYLLLRNLPGLVGSGLQSVNPMNPNNVVASTVNKAGGAIVDSTLGPTGAGMNADGSWTLGGAVFDLFHPETSTGAFLQTTPAPAQFDEWGNRIN